MTTATTTDTSHVTGQQVSPRGRQREAQQPVTQQERSAAQRLRTTMAASRLAFTWLGVRKTLAPDQRTTAARAFHADRELLSASKLILDTKNHAPPFSTAVNKPPTMPEPSRRSSRARCWNTNGATADAS